MCSGAPAVKPARGHDKHTELSSTEGRGEVGEQAEAEGSWAQGRKGKGVGEGLQWQKAPCLGTCFFTSSSVLKSQFGSGPLQSFPDLEDR